MFIAVSDTIRQCFECIRNRQNRSFLHVRVYPTDDLLGFYNVGLFRTEDLRQFPPDVRMVGLNERRRPKKHRKLARIISRR